MLLKKNMNICVIIWEERIEVLEVSCYNKILEVNMRELWLAVPF